MLVFELPHLFSSLVLKGILAIGEHQNGALCHLSAALLEQGLRHGQRLCQVREALLPGLLEDPGAHQACVLREGLHADGWRDRGGPIRHCLHLAIAKENHAHVHRINAKVLRLVLLRQVRSELPQDPKARLAQGAAGVQCNDKVLLRNADLVPETVMGVACLGLEAQVAAFLWAFALAADGHQDLANPRLHPLAVFHRTRHGAGRPTAPSLQSAILVARRGAAGSLLLD
mmetsp:Transcript_95856/g.222222  ORF Transcript_95856/g.222222 Transcript_95856/m.222222 type:complete len:229 (-) Transcript_95856:149-835(-)